MTAGGSATTGTGSYLFAVGPADLVVPEHGTDLPGFGPLRAVDTAGLRAVVANVELGALAPLRDPRPDGMDELAAIARAHDETVAGLARSGAVLPLRLGTVLPDDHAVAAVLRGRGTALRGELDRLAGHAEWSVTVRLPATSESGSVEPEEGAEEPEQGPDASAGRRYLEARAAAVDARGERRMRRQALSDEIHGVLASCAVAADRLGAPALDRAPTPLLRGVYLVATEDEAAFHRAVETVRRDHPAGVVEATGPWPAYHFVTVDLDVEVRS